MRPPLGAVGQLRDSRVAEADRGGRGSPQCFGHVVAERLRIDSKPVLVAQTSADRPDPHVIGEEDVAAVEKMRFDVPSIEVAWTLPGPLQLAAIASHASWKPST